MTKEKLKQIETLLRNIGFSVQDTTECKNSLYVYGPSSFENLGALVHALTHIEVTLGARSELRASSIYGNECLCLDFTFNV